MLYITNACLREIADSLRSAGLNHNDDKSDIDVLNRASRIFALHNATKDLSGVDFASTKRRYHFYNDCPRLLADLGSLRNSGAAVVPVDTTEAFFSRIRIQCCVDCGDRRGGEDMEEVKKELGY